MSSTDLVTQVYYELRIFEIVKDAVDVLVDIGCRENYEYALISPTTKMYLFDTSEYFIEKLNESIKDKEFNISTFAFGLSNKNAEVEYDERMESIQRHRFTGSNLSLVKIRKFDEIMEECDIVGKIDYLKIDIEGSEPEILEHYDIIKDIKYIQFEYGRGWPDLDNYNVWSVVEQYQSTHDCYYLKDPGHTFSIEDKNFPFLTPIDEEFHEDLHGLLVRGPWGQDCPWGQGGNIFMVRKDLKFDYEQINESERNKK